MQELTPAGLDTLTGRTFAAVLFDLDGTLIDSTPSVMRSWLSWAGHYGIDVAQLQNWHGIPARGVVAHFIPEAERAAAEAHITELEIADAPGIESLPGAVAALEALTGSGRCAIVTSGTHRLVEARLAATGLPRPEIIVTASDVTHGKPAPDAFLLAAQRLGVDPAECLVVEDAPAGLTAGKAAGCATLAVVSTHTAADLNANPDADAVVDTLADVRFTADARHGVRLASVAAPATAE